MSVYCYMYRRLRDTHFFYFKTSCLLGTNEWSLSRVHYFTALLSNVSFFYFCFLVGMMQRSRTPKQRHPPRDIMHIKLLFRQVRAVHPKAYFRFFLINRERPIFNPQRSVMTFYVTVMYLANFARVNVPGGKTNYDQMLKFNSAFFELNCLLWNDF